MKFRVVHISIFRVLLRISPLINIIQGRQKSKNEEKCSIRKTKSKLDIENFS